LRTPIAAVLAQMQLLSAQLVNTLHAERAARIVKQIKGLSSLAEKLLQLSRTGAGVVLLRERVDVMTILQVLIDEFRRVDGVGERLVLTGKYQDDFTVQGELDVIGITLRNLIENAVRYGAPDEPIEIVVERSRQIRLLNGGAVIPAESLESLKKPFVRGSSVGAGGGLGLAIADSVMKQIGGSLILASPAIGRGSGFEARLVFPDLTGSF
jgi:two-component system OmpR family sensor kinase